MTQVPATRASLFATCIVDQLYPQVGVSVVRVLRHLGVEVDFPPDQTCCGQPLYNSGFNQQAKKLAARVLDSFQESPYVVVPSGSCAAMMRVFYLDLFQDQPDQLRRAEEMAPRVYEFSQFLVQVLGVSDIGASFPGPAAYHPSCHLMREMNVREEPRQLLSHVSGLQLNDLPQAETCCGFGGAFSIKYPHISEGMLADKVASVSASGAETLVSCDMGCLMHIDGALSRQGIAVQTRHLAQILDSGSS
ncbi:MAG: (Fe-S)-binding protein [Chloroflexi bacterium]|nr:(Fe-S)-binding protein [Chloroflexota bacterium]